MQNGQKVLFEKNYTFFLNILDNYIVWLNSVVFLINFTKILIDIYLGRICHQLTNSMRLSQFKIKLAKHFWGIALSDNEQPCLSMNGHSSHQMKGAKFVTHHTWDQVMLVHNSSFWWPA